MKMRLTHTLILLLFVAVISCTKDSSTPSTPMHLYVAGEINAVATIWKDGVATPLTDGTSPAYLSCVKVSNKDVYVCGADNNGIQAKYWKNGTEVLLPSSGTINGHTIVGVDTEGMKIVDQDVYVAGSYMTGVNIFQAIYWKNGTVTSLSPYNSGAIEIEVSGTDVYVAGWETPNPMQYPSVAKYWKNGTSYSLSDGVHNASAYTLTLSGNDVYVGGAVANNNGVDVATYWKNGISHALTNGTRPAYVYSIKTMNGNVYIGGSEADDSGKQVATFWKNGVSQKIKVDTYNLDEYINEIVLSANGDIYAAISSSGGGPSYVLKNWRLITPFDGKNPSYLASSIQVD